MNEFQFGNYRVHFDADQTRAAHADMQGGGAERCICAECKNFSTQKPVRYPDDFLSLLRRLGIDPDREVEVFGFPATDPRVVNYFGWFYFVGSVDPDESSSPPYSRAPTKFRYYLVNGPAFRVPQFGSGPVSRVEFECLDLPWVDEGN